MFICFVLVCFVFFAFFTWWSKIKKQWFSNKTFDIFCNFDEHWHWAWDYYQSLSYNAFSILFKIFVSVNHLLWIGEAFLQKLFLFWIKSQSEKYLSSVSSDSCSSSYSSLELFRNLITPTLTTSKYLDI